MSDGLNKKRYLVKDPRKEQLSLSDIVDDIINAYPDLHKLELSNNKSAAERSCQAIRRIKKRLDEFYDRVREAKNEC